MPEQRVHTIPRAMSMDEARIWASCALFPHGFSTFLRYWPFVNREDGSVHTFRELWEGQEALRDAMIGHPWLFALKAGKLGFSELACAWDGYVALFGGPNARVHIFSMGGASAREILGWVRYGLTHLPDYLTLPVQEGGWGADNSTSLKLEAGPDDTRRVVSYASSPNASIDQSCQHLHADEFARWPYASTWQAARSTVAPGGSCHIITRGAGPNWAGTIYRQARQGRIYGISGERMAAFFAPYTMRPGRGETEEELAAWRAQEQASTTESGLSQWAPATWMEALSGDSSYVYPMWDNPPGSTVVPAEPCPLTRCEKIAVGIDPGGGNPTAMILVGERASGRAHVYAEFYKPGASIDEIEAQLVEWAQLAGLAPYGEGGYGELRIFGDWESVMLSTLQAHGWHAEAADKGRKEGIRLVTSRLNGRALTVGEDCIHLNEEAADYRWANVTDMTTRVVHVGDSPMKHHADAMDALRYAVVGLSQWVELVPHELPDGTTVWAVGGT